MPLITVDQGLNQSDPVTLKAGELSRADNAYYKPADPTLFKAKGNTAYNASPESAAIRGVRALQFDGSAGYFVTMTGTAYRKGTIGETGAFSDLSTGQSLTATSLDSVHYNNEHVLLNGVDRNRVARSDGTTILHGMLAATASPTIVEQGGSGTGFTLGSNNTIIYWVEERYKEGSTVVKRSASTPAETVTLPGTGILVKPTIRRPLTLNSDSTHWALFATATNGAFPIGGEIAEVAIGTDTIEDTRTGTDPAIPAGGNYQTITTTDIFGVSQTIARNAAPPISASGDIMEDSLVLVDATDKSRLRYSIPDKIHQFPANNLIRFETKEQDEIVAFRYIGNIGVALLRDSAWMIYSLPRPDDATFQGERVKRQIDGAFGCVGPRALDVFSFGDGMLLAYVAPEGIVWTDTRTWNVVTDDLDFDTLIEPSALHLTTLINNRDLYLLELRYAPVGSTRPTRTLLFHYHPSHLKIDDAGRLRCKVTGPLDTSGNAAAVALINRKHVVFEANEDGKLYRTWSGFSFASGQTPRMVMLTRDEYLAGIGGESMMRSLLVHHPAAAGQRASIKSVQHVHGQTDVTAETDIPLDFREATPTFGQAYADAFQFGFESSTTTAEVGITLFAPLSTPSALEGK